MRYQAPYGVSDPDSPYINGNPSLGIQGSIPPAAAFEEPMREIVAVINSSGITPDDGDLQQLAKGVRSQFMNFAQDVGTVDNLIVSFTPPLLTYTPGLIIRVLINNSNDGSSTIDAGAGRVLIKRTNGLPTQAGDLPAGGVVGLVFDGTAFQIMNYFAAGTGGGGTVTFNALPYCVDTSPTPNAINAPFSPAITTMPAGTAFLVKVANTTTGTTVVNVNAIANVPVRANGHGSLGPNDIAASDVKLFVYDGTYLWIDSSSVKSPSVGHGRCYLSLVSTTSLVLAPLNGNGIVISGNLYSLPPAGVSLTNAGLSANTLYYIYAQAGSGSAVQLIASTTGYVIDGNGIEVMSGVGANTLVGMVMTDATGLFQDKDGQLFVLSWFNRRPKRSRTSYTAVHSTTSSSYVELGVEIRNSFISWANAMPSFSTAGDYYCVGGDEGYIGISFDGGTHESEFAAVGGGVGGYNFSGSVIIVGRKPGLAEGKHYATLLGATSNFRGIVVEAPTTGALTAYASLSIVVDG
jgi:hypothetical protein